MKTNTLTIILATVALGGIALIAKLAANFDLLAIGVSYLRRGGHPGSLGRSRTTGSTAGTTPRAKRPNSLLQLVQCVTEAGV